jgi:hypothetical protein
MGIMAGSAEPKVNRTVNNLLYVQTPFVTDIAQFPFLPGKGEVMFLDIVQSLFTFRHVATSTLSDGHRCVNISLLPEILVALKASFLRILAGGFEILCRYKSQKG